MANQESCHTQGNDACTYCMGINTAIKQNILSLFSKTAVQMQVTNYATSLWATSSHLNICMYILLQFVIGSSQTFCILCWYSFLVSYKVCTYVYYLLQYLDSITWVCHNYYMYMIGCSMQHWVLNNLYALVAISKTNDLLTVHNMINKVFIK